VYLAMPRSRSVVRSMKRKYATRSKTPMYRSVRFTKPITKSSYARALVGSKGVGVGPSLRTQLKTIIWNKTIANASGIATFSLKSGSCFDPTGTLSGIQPAEYDQLKAMYGRYVVTGGTVKVTISNIPINPANPADPFVCCMYPDIDATAKTTFQDAASQDWSVCKNSASGSAAVVLYQKFSHAALLGKKGPVTSEDNGALVTADPSAGQFINHNIFIQGSGASQYPFAVLVELIQDVYFDRRVTVIDA